MEAIDVKINAIMDFIAKFKQENPAYEWRGPLGLRVTLEYYDVSTCMKANTDLVFIAEFDLDPEKYDDFARAEVTVNISALFRGEKGAYEVCCRKPKFSMEGLDSVTYDDSKTTLVITKACKGGTIKYQLIGEDRYGTISYRIETEIIPE